MKAIFVATAALLVSQALSANEYPTLERVDHVLTCMRLHGGQNVDNLYACSCEIDVIAQQVEFDDFTEARTYEIYEKMPGEKGGLFRDSDRGEEIRAKLEAAREDARKRCFIGMKKDGEAGAATPDSN
ncbi:MAG: hypothetical protein AB7Q81_21960 [Gammaproteobacteria bacterium]